MIKLYQDQKMKSKVNSSLGFILINNTEQKLRYYHASANKDRLLDKPVLIETLADFREFIDQLTDKDFIEYATQNRLDTSWSIHMITNIAFYVYPIYNHPIGCPVLLPDYIKNNVSPNGSTFHLQSLSRVMNAALSCASRLRGTCQYPLSRSKVLKYLLPERASRDSSIRGRG